MRTLMKPNDIFRLTEKLLFSYHENLARLDVLREDLRVLRASGDVHAQNYQSTFGFSSTPSDPVAAHVEKIISLENQIKRLERNTDPISRLVSDINKSAATAPKHSQLKDFQALLELFYFGGYTLYDVAETINKSRRTLSSRRSLLVMKAAGYLGF